MAQSSLPTEDDIRSFVYDWYRKLDVHADLQEYEPFLSQDDLQMVFPEAKLEGVRALGAWYRGGDAEFDLPGVINSFFDEVHELKRVDVSISSAQDARNWRAKVLIVVKWEAHRWKPPAAKGDYLCFDAWQRWA
jgi:hypothetical protein